jgi:gliding motility-associated-like protein
MRKIFLVLLFFNLFSNFFGQITTSINPSIAQMQALLQGNGVVVSGLTITCPAGAYATFANGAAALGGGLNSGILLTTGTASNIAGPPSGFNSLDNSFSGGAGSALGDALSGGTTFDGCYISFQITPTCATLSINYVFASEEYPEFATGTINDVFGFVLSGPIPGGGNYSQFNTALLPVTTTTSNVVSIQNVNNGSANTGPCTNCGYYVNNPTGLIYDGKTTVLTASAAVIPCETYTMTVGVWDESDGVWDSGVFLDVNGLSCANQPSLTVTVNPTTTCGPQTVTLTAVPSYTAALSSFTWSAPASGGLAATSGSVVTANPTAATTYTVKYSDTNTCPGFFTTQTVSLAFTAPPALPVSQTPTGAICAGQTVTLTASGGAGTYSWSPSNSVTSPSSSITAANPTVTTTYTVTKTVGACVSSAVITVNIGGSSVAITPSLSTICLGQSQALLASGVGPFVWTASSGANPPATANVTVTPSSTTTYTVLSGTGTCTVTAIASVSVTPSFSISITPASTIICNGQSTNLSVVGSTGPFVWTASVGNNPAATGTVNVSPLSTTTYTVLSSTGACTTQAVSNVSVSPTLTVTITPNNTTICYGSGTTLTASGATSYTWFPSLNSTSSLSVNPTTNASYSLVGTNGVCVNSATATVNVITVTTSVSASSAFYCIGVAPVILTGSGASTYSWSPGTDLSSTIGAVVTATSAATTIYSLTGTTNGCSSTQTISITVPPVSTITATTSNSIICIGGSGTILTATGANTYTWSPGLISTPSFTDNPATTTTYTVIGQSLAGCYEVPAVVTVTVLTSINPSMTISSPTVCLTKSVTISVPAVANLTYTWQPTNAILGANNTFSIVAIPPSTSTVIYTVTISNGACGGTDTIQLKVKTPPNINDLTTLNNDTICVGGCVTFSATTSGSQPIFYQWYYENGVGTSSVGVAPEACYPSAGSFSVVATASNSCGVDTLLKNSYVTVYDLPILIVRGDTTINIGESTEIFASGGITYYWSPNNNNSIACVTCSNTIVKPTLTTQYIVVASNSLYCKVQDTVTIIVDINCGDFFIPNVFSPNDDGLNDLINVHGRCISTFNLQIFNRWGEKVFETTTLENSWDGSFKGKKMDTGVFIYKADGVSIDGQSFKLKGNITLIR